MSRTHEAGEHAQQESTKTKKGLGTGDPAHSRVLVSNAYKTFNKEGGKEEGRTRREGGREIERGGREEEEREGGREEVRSSVCHSCPWHW